MRIIPRLDIKAPNLVKGIRLEGLRIVGNPKDFAKRYFEEGADEIYYQDIVASLYNRNTLDNLVTETAKEVFIPLTVGGGLRTLDDIQKILRSGADKVCLNTAAVKNPQLIAEGAKKFGSQCIIVAIETIRQKNGSWKAFTDNGREHSRWDAYDWVMRAVELGAGEILLTSVDHEGRKQGFDLEFIEKIARQIPVPVVAHGGAGSLQHIIEAAKLGVDGLALAHVLHYKIHTIQEIKTALSNAGFEVRGG